MLKPDAVQRGMTGKIVAKFELKGFKLVAMKLCMPGRAHMEAHYADLAGKKFFPSLVDYMVSGPVCAMVWEGDNVVATGRLMLGATRPADSLPGTLRGDNCIDVGRNIIHGSDCVEAAQHEIGLWWTASELIQYTHHSGEWVYEMPEPKAAFVKPVYAECAATAALDAKLVSSNWLGGAQPSQEDAWVSAAIKAG
jgi:nucleoside-diphosphate kinase